MTRTQHNRIANTVLSFFVLASVGCMPTIAKAAYVSEALPTTEVYSDFVVGPGKVELTLKPGESRTIEVTLANRMGDDREYEVVVEDMKGSNDPEQTVVLLGDDRGPYSLRDSFSVPEWKFMLPHARKARIPVTVSIPENAEPGGYYGSVLFTTTSKKNEDAPEQGAAAIVSRIGVLFFVTVPGGQGYEGALESFNTAQTYFTKGPIPFQMLFRNSGTMHVNPSGEITIKNMIGTQVDTVMVEPWFALPDSLRLREVEWNRKALMGRYTAEAAIKRGYGDQVDRMTLTFWVIPLVPVAIGVGGLFILFFIIRFFATHFEFKRKS
jgi:hypothetical protein